MKLKNGIYALALIGMIFITKPAHAVIYADQVPATFGQSDDENSDAVSRFGVDQTKNKAKPVAQPLDPISENSFEQDHSRSPASVIEDATPSRGRGPAGATSKSSKKSSISQERRAKSYQEIAVIANDTGFYPSTVFLTQGIPVRMYITGASTKSQCFMLDQFGVRRQIRSQKIEEVTFVPDQVGTFTFNCPMNGAKGNLVVKDLDVNERIPASVSNSESAALANAQSRSPDARTEAPVQNKAPDIHDDDFTPEFRSP
jgi:hypothetical protein